MSPIRPVRKKKKHRTTAKSKKKIQLYIHTAHYINWTYLTRNFSSQWFKSMNCTNGHDIHTGKALVIFFVVVVVALCQLRLNKCCNHVIIINLYRLVTNTIFVIVIGPFLNICHRYHRCRRWCQAHSTEIKHYANSFSKLFASFYSLNNNEREKKEIDNRIFFRSNSFPFAIFFCLSFSLSLSLNIICSCDIFYLIGIADQFVIERECWMHG